MKEFIATFICVLIAIFAMAFGIIFAKRQPGQTCHGQSEQCDKTKQTACDVCNAASGKSSRTTMFAKRT